MSAIIKHVGGSGTAVTVGLETPKTSVVVGELSFPVSGSMWNMTTVRSSSFPTRSTLPYEQHTASLGG